MIEVARQNSHLSREQAGGIILARRQDRRHS
jgi:hypothetical protein